MVEKNDYYGFETNGHLFLQSVYNEDSIHNFNKELKDFFVKNSIYVHLQKNYDVNEDSFFVNNTYTLLTNNQKIQYYYSPVINNRGNINRTSDAGFIEIVNADRLFRNLPLYFDIDLISKLVHKVSSESWKLQQINIEVYNNVGHPNGFHYEEKRLKVIVFLSTIQNDDSGTYSYIEKTNNNKMEVKNENIKLFYGKGGDILIMDSNGYHKLMPQKQCTSVYLVFYFTQNM
jgi:hypothetical protein